VNEILEHLALVERRFEARVAEAIAKARAAGLDREGDVRIPLDEDLRRTVRDRSGRRKAPEAVIPSGAWDHTAAWAALDAARQSFRETVGSADGLALNTVTSEHHRWGALTVYQWVEVLANHEARHAEQIVEVAAALRSAGV
jgi:DinB superfamily